MQGFNYSQLVQALQDWPVETDDTYVANIPRLIFAAERRVVVDLDLDIFDVTDTTPIALTAGQNTLAKPTTSLTTLTFTAALADGAVGASLTSAWNGVSGQYTVMFQDSGDAYQQWRLVTLTNGDVVADWSSSPLTAAANNKATLMGSSFLVERALWVIYSGTPLPIIKRTQDWVRAYAGAANVQPRYYCELNQSTWMFAPAADANATGILRRYISRPTSIVIAGNTFLGDNVGDLLFTAVLIEAEDYLKNDDRHADMLNKYATELLPNARDELRLASRFGNPNLPPAPGIVLPAPPPTPRPNGAQPT